MHIFVFVHKQSLGRECCAAFYSGCLRGLKITLNDKMASDLDVNVLTLFCPCSCPHSSVMPFSNPVGVLLSPSDTHLFRPNLLSNRSEFKDFERVGAVQLFEHEGGSDQILPAKNKCGQQDTVSDLFKLLGFFSILDEILKLWKTLILWLFAKYFNFWR